MYGAAAVPQQDINHNMRMKSAQPMPKCLKNGHSQVAIDGDLWRRAAWTGSSP